MSEIYKQTYISDLGYVVFRDIVDDKTVPINIVAKVHKQAVFVDENTAQDYCNYRNKLIKKNGSDELKKVI